LVKLVYIYDKLSAFLAYNSRMADTEVEQKYIDYIDNLVEQIHTLLPKDINALQEDYLISNIKKSTMLLAKSMQEDTVFMSLDFPAQCVYIQIMAEWSFHKEIDLFRSGIPPKYWKTVMQKIWYTMWEVMYACIQNNAPESVVLNIVEKYVNRTYQDAVEELKDSHIINEETEEKAKEQSNIDIMARDYLKERKHKRIKKHLYYAFLLILITIVVSFTVLTFKVYGIIAILVAMVVYNFARTERND